MTANLIIVIEKYQFGSRHLKSPGKVVILRDHFMPSGERTTLIVSTCRTRLSILPTIIRSFCFETLDEIPNLESVSVSCTLCDYYRACV